MPARNVCLVALSLSEAGPGRFGGQASVMDIYHAMPCHSAVAVEVLARHPEETPATARAATSTGHGAPRTHHASSEDTTGYWVADSLVPSPLSLLRATLPITCKFLAYTEGSHPLMAW